MALDYVDTANNFIAWNEVASELSFGTGDFTILARVFPDTVNYGAAEQGTIISRDFTAYELYIYQGTFGCYCGGASNNPTATAISAGSWQSVGTRRSGSSLQIYKDGAFSAASTNAATASGSGNVGMGNRGGSAALALDGRLQDVAMWKGAALSDAEFASYAAGFPARRIRPQSLVYDCPQIRGEKDRRQARTISNGADFPTAAAHNRSYG